MTKPRLFWQIFLWFWASCLVVLTVFGVTLFWVLQATESKTEIQLQLQESEFHARDMGRRIADNMANRQGDRPLRFPTSAFVVNAAAQAVDGRRVPPAVAPFMQAEFNAQQLAYLAEGDYLYVGPFPISGQPQVRLFFRRDYHPERRLTILHAVLLEYWPFVLLPVLLSMVLCALLARRIIAPIRRVQRLAKQVSEADFSGEITAHDSRRSDEFGELFQSIAVMSAQIRKLLAGHQTLLRDVSHELRSPLTRLSLRLAIARKKLPAEDFQGLAEMDGEVARLNTLISQLLEYSRLDHGIISEDLHTVQPREFLTQITDSAAFEAQQNQRQLVVRDHLPALEFACYPQLLTSAIDNVLRNAIRFTPAECTVEVDLRVCNNHLIIRIRDFGAGLPEDDLQHIFQPFVQSKANKTANQGSGVGLSIAAKAVELHHGTLVAENAQPGLRVVFSLPIAV